MSGLSFSSETGISAIIAAIVGWLGAMVRVSVLEKDIDKCVSKDTCDAFRGSIIGRLDDLKEHQYKMDDKLDKIQDSLRL